MPVLRIKLVACQLLTLILLGFSAACTARDDLALATTNDEFRAPTWPFAGPWSSAHDTRKASGGIIALSGWSIAAGGGVTGNGTRLMQATLGQSQPGSASGGSISLQSGFWFASSSLPPAASHIFDNGFE